MTPDTEEALWDLYPDHWGDDFPAVVDYRDLDLDTWEVIDTPAPGDLTTWDGFHSEVRRRVYEMLPAHVGSADESHDVSRTAEQLAAEIRPAVLADARAAR
jgi:hypothetical protein